MGFGHLINPDGLNRMREQFLRPIDTCKVVALPHGTPVSNLDGPVFNLDLEPVPAGQVVTVRSDSGTLAEFHGREFFGRFDGYSIQSRSDSGTDVAGPAPSDIVVDIPGGTFPAVNDIRIPNIQSFRAISPAAGERLRIGETVRWEAGNDPHATIMLRATGVTPSGAGALVTMECTMADDGEFVIPAATQRSLESVIVTFTPAFGRRKLSVEHQNGAAVVVENFSGRKSGTTF